MEGQPEAKHCFFPPRMGYRGLRDTCEVDVLSSTSIRNLEVVTDRADANYSRSTVTENQ